MSETLGYILHYSGLLISQIIIRQFGINNRHYMLDHPAFLEH